MVQTARSESAAKTTDENMPPASEKSGVTPTETPTEGFAAAPETAAPAPSTALSEEPIILPEAPANEPMATAGAPSPVPEAGSSGGEPTEVNVGEIFNKLGAGGDSTKELGDIVEQLSQAQNR